MKSSVRRNVRVVLTLLALLAAPQAVRVAVSAAEDGAANPDVTGEPDGAGKPDGALILVVMDPLAAPLACDCVKGYAQRKYEALGNFLTEKLQRPVKVVWGESLETATQDVMGRADIVIGKHSVVESDARAGKLDLMPVAQLTGKDGSVTQTGLLVVRSADRATKVGDLAGYRIFFGPEDCAEKSSAVMELLKEQGVAIPETIERSEACSSAASMLLELDASEDAAAVISSYAQPMLEGCGTIKKGDLRVVGESRPVAFVTAFVNQALETSLREEVTSALLETGKHAELKKLLETRKGFVAYEDVAAKQDAAKQDADGAQAAEKPSRAAKKKS